MWRILFRADGGPTIGDGHLMRCLALAQHIVDRGGTCRLVTADPAARPVGDWKNEGVDVELLPCDAGGDADAHATVLAAKTMRADFVVADGYAFKADYFTSLAKSGFSSLRFDDICERGLKADIVVNQNPGAQERCVGLQDSQSLLGCEYVMLRRTLRSVASRSAPTRPHVLLTLGGYDPDNLAPAIGAAVFRKTTDLTATLVCAGGAREFAAAEQWSRDHADQVDVVAPGNIDNEMVRTDLAICAGGTTSLELASIGVPMDIVIRAENQRPGAH